ncbi:uncharacterized protein KQ657_003814 [Scheffersomyces spartinae]|uniref:Uncharacterized protein n=1 Tax=Scheffersomyces spartinae TaxID=45513 RepID=A0A9P7VCH9_9ASCO|nr:uncharacterized protein KQ657_003814 [Scheffersomyces spartinae]KAG7195288.1 hypothetical protein KQ657_003814 [Scheffersomyces spartinae]
MVLKNSKWDKKAKYKYLKKHGLTKSETCEGDGKQESHWSSKKPTSSIIVEESDSDWDSDEDEALINHFYPNMGGETALTIEQKKKIRKQILVQLEEEAQKREDTNDDAKDGSIEEQDPDQEQEESEIDGIYLGTKPRVEKETLTFDLNQILENAKSSKSSGKRYFKQKMSTNFLEDYGLGDYKETVAKQDVGSYNTTHYEKKLTRKLDDISFDELEGFEIGKSVLGESQATRKPQIQTLTEEDMEQEKRRQHLVNDNKLYTTLRNKYSTTNQQKKSKVLEINNLNSKDSSQLDSLNSRIIKSQNDPQVRMGEIDDHLSELLGEVALAEDRAPISNGDPLDEILKASKLIPRSENKKTTSQMSGIRISPTLSQSNAEHDAFLDDLLG